MAERRSERRDDESIRRPGDYRFTLTHGGLQRAYRVHVPKSYRADRATPVVLALHGGAGNMNYQADDANYGLITKSEEAGFIAVFPNGYSALRSGMVATWNAGSCCGPARDKNIDDVGFLRALIERVSAQVNVDRQRIYSIGMSNGAMMSYRLACEAADLIRGIMAVAGTDNTRECRPTRPVPVLVVHARDDDHVLYEGGAGTSIFKSSSVTAFVSVPGSVAKWVGLNGSQPTATRVLSVPGAYCDLHPAGAGGAPVQLCVTETGMHSWPGGQKRRAAQAPSQAIKANDVMWEFFTKL